MILYVLLTHQPEEEVRSYLEHFERVLPGRRLVVCHGGTREDFGGLAACEHAMFVDDPALRRRHGQSYTRVLALVHERLVAPDPGCTAVHLMEYDHVVLSPRYEAELLEVLSGERVGLLAPSCADHTMANWRHAIDLLDDAELEGLLRHVSVRDQDPPSIWGALGSGMTLSRDALEGFSRRAGDLARYMEAYVPTVVFHLGYRVVDAPDTASLFDHVRYAPPYGVEEARRATGRGALALHPVKDPAVRAAAVEAALG